MKMIVGGCDEEIVSCSGMTEEVDQSKLKIKKPFTK